MLKSMIGPRKGSKEEDLTKHEQLVDCWREAIQAAETKIDGWPLHVSSDGSVVMAGNEEGYDYDSSRVTDVIVEAIEMSHENEGRGQISHD